MDVHSYRTTGQIKIIIHRQWPGISVFQCPQNYNYWLTNSPKHSEVELVANNCNSLGIKNTITLNQKITQVSKGLLYVFTLSMRTFTL